VIVKIALKKAAASKARQSSCFFYWHISSAILAEFFVSCHVLYFAYYQQNEHIFNYKVCKKKTWHKE